MRHTLIPHPRSPCEAVAGLEVEVVVTEAELMLTYRLTGDLSRLVVPEPAAPARVDGLWAHTCFEAFVGGADEAYAEFNLAPSGEWAAYGFNGYRQGMRRLDLQPPAIETIRDAGRLEVATRLARPPGSRLGLTAVIEEVGGRLSYWALAHPATEPNFHHRGGLVLSL